MTKNKKLNYFFGNPYFFHLSKDEEYMLLEAVMNSSDLCNEVSVEMDNIEYFPIKVVLRCLKKAYNQYIPSYHSKIATIERKILNNPMIYAD